MALVLCTSMWICGYNSISFEKLRKSTPTIFSLIRIQNSDISWLNDVSRVAHVAISKRGARPKLEQMFEIVSNVRKFSTLHHEKRKSDGFSSLAILWSNKDSSYECFSFVLIFFLSVLFESTHLVRDKQSCCFCFGIVSLS